MDDDLNGDLILKREPRKKKVLQSFSPGEHHEWLEELKSTRDDARQMSLFTASLLCKAHTVSCCVLSQHSQRATVFSCVL